jgi:hypothetical protein
VLARPSGRGSAACSEGVTLRSWRGGSFEASRRMTACLEQHGRQGFWRQAPISERSKALKVKAQERSRGEINPRRFVLCLLDRLAGSVPTGRLAGSLGAERPLGRSAGAGVGALGWRASSRFAGSLFEARNHAAR